VHYFFFREKCVVVLSISRDRILMARYSTVWYMYGLFEIWFDCCYITRAGVALQTGL
jgi:hypothetical protein